MSEDHTGRYERVLERLLKAHDWDTAHQRAVGGNFSVFGPMERDLLISLKLRPDHVVIDVGCGSGRLALPLSQYLTTGAYLGTDLVPGLLDYARNLVDRPSWRFELVDDLIIPAEDESADFVCFFSVFTHLRYEETFVYLKEARRVLKRTGLIVFSFHEFRIPAHWSVFENSVERIGLDDHVNQFIGRDAIRAWADHLDLDVALIFPGDVANIPLTEPIIANGASYERFGKLGQSVAVLARA